MFLVDRVPQRWRARHYSRAARFIGETKIQTSLAVVCIAYILVFFGRSEPITGTLLLDSWSAISGLTGHAIRPPGSLSAWDQMAVVWASEAMFLGLLLPVIVGRLFARMPGSMGLAMPQDGRSWRLTAWGIPVVLPIIIWLSETQPNPWGSLLFESLELISMLPEHFLVFGILGAIMLPGHRLSPGGMHHSAHAGSQGQPSVDVYVVAVTGITFGLLHVGEALQAEAIVSFPVGLFFGYMTLSTGSIWPALIVHWAVNLLPYSWHVARASW